MKYKFDPMDFETNIAEIYNKDEVEYKFDPMDFETPGNDENSSDEKSINLILWILKLSLFGR